MTRTTSARIAGFTFLFYIAAGIAQMALFARDGTAAKLAGFTQQGSAVVLAVTLYRITRDVGPNLAILAMTCRVAEGTLGTILKLVTAGLLWLATVRGTDAPDGAAASAVAAVLMKMRWSVTLSAILFAVGSTLFSWLLLRGRMIPMTLAWLGVVASVLLVVGLPLQLAGLLTGPVTQLLWIPMAAFEIPLGFWLLIKGVRAPVVA